MTQLCQIQLYGGSLSIKMLDFSHCVIASVLNNIKIIGNFWPRTSFAIAVLQVTICYFDVLHFRIHISCLDLSKTLLIFMVKLKLSVDLRSKVESCWRNCCSVSVCSACGTFVTQQFTCGTVHLLIIILQRRRCWIVLQSFVIKKCTNCGLRSEKHFQFVFLKFIILKGYFLR